MDPLFNQPILDLETPPGDRVIFSHPENGQDWDRTHAANYLELGGEYTVKEMKVGPSSSSVILMEFPDQTFNTVHFTNVLPVDPAKRVDWYGKDYSY